MVNRSYTIYDGPDIIDQGEHDVTWEQVRELRNQALEDSDWRAVSDRTISQAWEDYRQALRDLPQDNATANDAADNFPVMPDA